MRKSSRSKKSVTSLFSSGSKERNWGGDGTLICPDSVRVKLPFTQTLTPGTTSGGLYTYQYRGNSGFDPDYTGVGLQPNGFDQWSQFYNTYVVLGSELVVEFVASGAYASELVVVPAFNTAAPANTKEAAGWRYAKTYLNVPNGNATYKKVVSQMATAEICGVPQEEVVYDTDFSATVNSSPGSANTWYWDIFLQNVSNSTTLADVLRVTLYLDIKFMAPVQQAFSATRRTITAGGPRLESCCCAACRSNDPEIRALCKRQ
jgi:hypothetical protein